MKITNGENDTIDMGFVLTKNVRNSLIVLEFGSIVNRKSHLSDGIFFFKAQNMSKIRFEAFIKSIICSYFHV